MYGSDRIDLVTCPWRLRALTVVHCSFLAGRCFSWSPNCQPFSPRIRPPTPEAYPPLAEKAERRGKQLWRGGGLHLTETNLPEHHDTERLDD